MIRLFARAVRSVARASRLVQSGSRGEAFAAELDLQLVERQGVDGTRRLVYIGIAVTGNRLYRLTITRSRPAAPRMIQAMPNLLWIC